MMFVSSLEEGEEIAFLSYEDILEIHELALLSGGLPGFLNPDHLRSAVARPENVEYYEGERDLLVLAAYLWHAVTMAHGFCDGNKRTAFLACTAFLGANGVIFDAAVRPEEPGVFVEQCFADESFTVEKITLYLRTRCRWDEGL